MLSTTIINTRDDLDALIDTPVHAEFMALLEGSLWLIQRDDVNRRFVAIEDDTTIERFQFTRADFPDAQPPALPEWTPPPSDVPQIVSPLQAMLALKHANKLDDVEAYLNDPATDPIKKLAWEKAVEFKRESPLLLEIAEAVGLGSSDLDALFIDAASIEV
jgi:hypothetical protein